jgi:hypothetical protein
MSEITPIGLDLAKHVFQVHGVDAQGTTVLRKRLRRGQVLAFFSRIPRCVVGLEACATAHYWARELGALGHEVRLMPAQYVRQHSRMMPDKLSFPGNPSNLQPLPTLLPAVGGGARAADPRTSRLRTRRPGK